MISIRNDFKSELYKYPEGVIQQVLEDGNMSSYSLVVDMGCGTGTLTTQLVEKGINTIGIDKDELQLKSIFELKKYYNCSLIKSKAEYTPLKDKSVDAVVVGNSFHLFNSNDFLVECNRVLRNENNIFILNNKLNWNSYIFNSCESIIKSLNPNINLVKKDNKQQILLNLGFEIKKMENNKFLSLQEFKTCCLSLIKYLNLSEILYYKYLLELTSFYINHEKDGRICVPMVTEYIHKK